MKRDYFKYCGHGISYKEPCGQCELISADSTVKSFGRIVDDARKKLADAGPEELHRAYNPQPQPGAGDSNG